MSTQHRVQSGGYHSRELAEVVTSHLWLDLDRSEGFPVLLMKRL